MPDLRTAAQREAVTKAYNIVTGQDERAAPDATLAALEELWAAARVTHTREQIRERMQAHHFEDCVYDGGQLSNWWFAKCTCGWTSQEFLYPQHVHHAYYAHASEQVAALMQELAEGEK